MCEHREQQKVFSQKMEIDTGIWLAMPMVLLLVREGAWVNQQEPQQQ